MKRLSCYVLVMALLCGCSVQTEVSSVLPVESASPQEPSWENSISSFTEARPSTSIEEESEESFDNSLSQSKQDADNSARPVEQEAENASGIKHRLLTEHTLNTNDEVCDMLIYLLEHGSELNDEEAAQLEATTIDDYANISVLYNWYRTNALDTLRLQVIEKEMLCADRSARDEYSWFEAGADYLLKINMIDSGDSGIQTGVQNWVFQTVLPSYGMVAICPDQLITLEEYNLRMECRKYADSIRLVCLLRELFITEPFENIRDIPNDKLVHYVVYRAMQEGMSTRMNNGYGAFNQEELDAAALKFLGISHLNPDESDSDEIALYDSETGLYTAWGYGPPLVYDYFWRVKEDEKGVHLDYFVYWSEKHLRYTVKNGRVIRAVDISEEIAGNSFGIIKG